MINGGTAIDGNSAVGGDGGGIALGGAANVNTVATIDGSTISNNTTDAGGGGIGQFVTSTLTVTNTTISGNGPTESASDLRRRVVPGLHVDRQLHGRHDQRRQCGQ